MFSNQSYFIFSLLRQIELHFEPNKTEKAASLREQCRSCVPLPDQIMVKYHE